MSICSWRRPVMTTCEPSATKRLAVARPIPLLPPVITATLPSSTFAMVVLILLRVVASSICQLTNLLQCAFYSAGKLIASGFAEWACGFSPPGVSQALNPTLEALGLRRHQTGIMKGMSQDRNALHGGKQVHGKAFRSWLIPFMIPVWWRRRPSASRVGFKACEAAGGLNPQARTAKPEADRIKNVHCN